MHTSLQNQCLNEELQNSINSSDYFEEKNADLLQDAQGKNEGPTNIEELKQQLNFKSWEILGDATNLPYHSLLVLNNPRFLKN